MLDRRKRIPGEYADQAQVDRHIALMSPGGERITSPHDIAVVEQLRAKAFAGGRCDPGRAIPTDVFVFSLGEPARREVTKVGGLPYRPAADPWPTHPSGRSMTFIGQLCFAD